MRRRGFRAVVACCTHTSGSRMGCKRGSGDLRMRVYVGCFRGRRGAFGIHIRGPFLCVASSLLLPIRY